LDPVIPFPHRQYAHCESGVVAALLTQYGLAISEPLVFGISGGLTFAYIPFIKITNLPIISYRMFPHAIIQGIQKRLGIRFRTRTYRDPQKAHGDLVALLSEGRVVGLQTSVYWLPYFPDEMRFQFNAHNLIVYGMEDGEFLVSDPIADHLVRIAPADLENARFAKGTLAPRGFLYYPEDVPSSIALEEPIRKAIRKTAQMMLYAPVPLIGVKGIRTLAGRIERLRRHPDGRYVRNFLGHIVRMQEEIGTGGGGFRFMYAAFLQEAGEKLGLPVLKEASERMTESGDLWRTFALACARACKRKGDPVDFTAIADLARRCADFEERVFRMLLRMERTA
jgi:hypothetical protein